jgi:hypothetical protein
LRRLLLPVTTACFLFSACADQEAAERHRHKLKIAAALELQQQASADFVPKGGDGRDDRSLSSYRQDRRVAQGGFIENLQGAMAPESSAEQFGVRRMLADAHNFSARYVGDEAMRNWADLSDQTTAFVNELSNIDGATGRHLMFTRSDQKVLAELRETRAAVRVDRTALQSRLETLDDQIKSQRDQIEQHRGVEKRKTAEAARHALAAGRAAGQEILDLADQASAATRVAIEADVRAKQAQLSVDDLESERRVVKQQIDLLREAIDAHEKHIAAVETRQQQVEQGKADAQKQRQAMFASLREKLESLTADFARRVDAPLEQADNHMAKAAEAAEQAPRHSPNDSRREADLELVATRVGRAHVLTQRIVAQASFAHTLGLVARSVDQLLEGVPQATRTQYGTEVYRNQATQMARRHAALVADAIKVVRTGLEEAAELADRAGDGPIGQSALVYEQLLRTYERRISGSADGRIADADSGTSPAGPAMAEAASESDVAQLATGAPAGELPPLPDEAFGAGIGMLLWVDSALLTPESLKATSAMLLAANASMLKGPLAKFEQSYDRFRAHGGTSLVAAMRINPPPQEKDPVLFISLQEDADEEGLLQWLEQLNPTPDDKMRTSRSGPWLVVHGDKFEPPVAGDPKRSEAFRQCVQEAGRNPVVVAVVPDESMLQAVGEAGNSGLPIGPDALGASIEDVRWFAASLRLGEAFGLYSTTHYDDEQTAATAAAQVHEKLNQSVGGEQGGPMAMFLLMLKSAIKIDQQGPKVRIDLAGPALRGLVGMAAPMMAQLGGQFGAVGDGGKPVR